MNKKQAKSLFDKYVKDECSEQEKELLGNYLDSFQDKNKLWSELEYDEEIKDEIWQKIQLNFDRIYDKKPFSFRPYLKYAAVFIGLISCFIYYQLKNNTYINTDELVIDSAITLKTSDNKVTKISTDKEQYFLDDKGKVLGVQKGNQINYHGNSETKELIYNEILVPNGKKFQLILSDGTMVHINSGTSLKYPVNFISGKKREVFLEGEAYFEVAKDEENPFLVTTSDVGIEVLGTHFNVSSFEGAETFTVLAEGSVAVYDNNLKEENVSTIIKPGEKATLIDDKFEVNTVNIEDYLSWRKGKLSFNNEPFNEIIKKIERRFGVAIFNKYTALDSVRFNGTFSDETIIDLLDTFKESAQFNYQIENNLIIIKYEEMKTE